MISVGMDLFCEGWLWYVLCVVYNFSRLRLFCRIISYIGPSKVERQSTRESGVTVLLWGLKKNYPFVIRECYLVSTM